MNETLQAKDQSNAPRCEAEHSPLPWFAVKPDGNFYTTDIRDTNGNHVGNIQSVPYRTTGRADAAYIVKACNERPELLEQRDELMEALKGLLQRCKGLDQSPTVAGLANCDAMRDARQAIANAEKSNG